MKRYYRIIPLFLQNLFWLIIRPTFVFFLNIEIYGKENLRKLPRGTIFAVNHSSEIDPILVTLCFPFLSRLSPMFYVSRESKLYQNSGFKKYFYGGYLFRAWGAYPAYTNLNNYELSLRHHIRLLNEGNSLTIFPEGGIPKDGLIKEARGGVVYLATRTNSPIVPVKIEGVYKLTLSDFILRRRKVTIQFGEVINIKESFNIDDSLPIKEYKNYAQNILENIKTLSLR